MVADRLLLDTFFVLALLNADDEHHARAKPFLSRVRTASEVVVTEAVILEIGNGLSDKNRAGAVEFIRSCYTTSNITVVNVDTPLLNRAIDLYDRSRDKTWGLTDCISFVVMNDRGLQFALTGDRDFKQAGFVALMLDP
ncbi:MAG: type II toxin-antitoxin system VapC family toxin [Candidatus Methylomirabilaceae bacterium]